ncbi:DUF1998 domain-containing protein [Lysinibacillus capsici]|uniref:DUF1998 domain-containing protein n=1 Tax=Lysinibacillus capsici TaxID=2115968 RepID=UPI00279B026A|nr:DUF1998 domain-containing protein [Lysinibacillus boronitolerans]
MTKNEVGEVRPGQLITTFGPGAIMDAVKDSLVILDISYWRNNLADIEDERLGAFLGKEKFKKIPTRGFRDLPAIPFPNYHICSNTSCRRLFDLSKNFDIEVYLKYGPICLECSSDKDRAFKAYPSRFVVSCDSGNHLDDFPWHWWVHKKSGNLECNSKLKLSSSGNNSGLSSISVTCETCGEWNHMGGAMQRESFTEYPHKCEGNHPHLLNKKEGCNGEIVPLQRGASNVYFPALRSAISIPIENKNSKRIEDLKLEIFLEIGDDLENLIGEFEEKDKAFDFYYRLHKKKLIGIESGQDLASSWDEYKRNKNTHINVPNYNKIKEMEYEVLTDINKAIKDDNIFKGEEVTVPNDLSKYFSRIIKAHRLKEILVLLGFSRNDSPEPETKNPTNIVRLGDNQTNWLPAVEIIGEGIFIEFNKETISQWLEENVILQVQSKKYNELYNDYIFKKGWTEQTKKDAIYVMLHTFSHLLMKQFSLQCGYSSSAIKERIYYSENMAGILIYTGSTDQEGSLGGLVEMGEVDNLRKAIIEALDEARFCSNDPSCSTQIPSEDNYINGVSCFACTMLPETSCEVANMLLDRSLVVKTMDSKYSPYFKGLY